MVIGTTVVGTTRKCAAGAAPCTGIGIDVSSDSLVVNNVANNNADSGIVVALGLGGGTVIGNTAAGNVGFGLSLSDNTVGYANNTLRNNNGRGAQVSGGTQIGMNLCNGTLCKP